MKACVSHGTNYVDVTGEGRWVEQMKLRYNEIAKRNGVILVPFAGNDCVPIDLTAWFTTSQIAAKEMEESHAALITGTKFPTNGTVSHGTIKTILAFAETGSLEQFNEIPISKPPRLSTSVQLIHQIPHADGGPLVLLPTRSMVDGKVVHDSHAEQQAPGRAAVFEAINGLI